MRSSPNRLVATIDYFLHPASAIVLLGVGLAAERATHSSGLSSRTA